MGNSSFGKGNMELKGISHISYCFFLLVICLSIRGHRVTSFNISAHLQCTGSIAECQAGNEMLMESDIARRILEQRRHISFGALRQDQPACGGGPRGQAYSNNAGCLPPAANPYHRGCSKYYRCKRDS